MQKLVAPDNHRIVSPLAASWRLKLLGEILYPIDDINNFWHYI